MDPILRFAVLCRHIDGEGTTWIDTIQFPRFPTPTLEEIKVAGVKACLIDWDFTEDPKDIHVLGVLQGEIKVIHWEDACEIL